MKYDNKLNIITWGAKNDYPTYVLDTYNNFGSNQSTQYRLLHKSASIISVPDNLYHPQGSNIIIQGDPTAINQRYLYRVKNYSYYCCHQIYYN